MNIDAVIIEAMLASIVYPGLTAICVLWVSIAIARWMTARRLLELLLAAAATFAAATFGLLSFSTGLLVLVPFEQLRFGIRLGWLITLVLAILTSVEFLRLQHATYRQR